MITDQIAQDNKHSQQKPKLHQREWIVMTLFAGLIASLIIFSLIAVN